MTGGKRSVPISFAGLLFFALVLGYQSAAVAVELDLTTANAFGTINGAVFKQVPDQPTGTGFIDSFVEVLSNDDITQAYNTTVNGVLDNGSSNQFNHQLLVSDLTVVPFGEAFCASPTGCWQFLLDVNQEGSDPQISLDELQIFRSDTANQSVETFTGDIVNIAGTLIYDLDGGGDNWITLDFSIESGSGSGDMLANIPVSGTGNFLYLYSLFGQHDNANDGFEEWAANLGRPIPEPASLLLLASGLMVLGLLGRKKAFNGSRN